MNLPLLLGQAETRVVNDVQWVPLDEIWNQITALTWLQAVIAVSFGLVYMLYGWRIFRILVVISFALIGMFLGIWLGANQATRSWAAWWGRRFLGRFPATDEVVRVHPGRAWGTADRGPVVCIQLSAVLPLGGAVGGWPGP